MEDRMKVKGTAVQSLPLYVKNAFQEQGYRRWLEALSPEETEILGKPLHATEWYPLAEALIGPTGKACDLFFDGKMEGAWEAGRFSADHGLRGIYKILIRFRSASYLFKRAGTILPTYYDPSRIEVLKSEKRHAVMRIVEFPQMHEIIECRIGGWIQKALELCGCGAVKVEVPRSLTRGDGYTEIVADWI